MVITMCNLDKLEVDFDNCSEDSLVDIVRLAVHQYARSDEELKYFNCIITDTLSDDSHHFNDGKITVSKVKDLIGEIVLSGVVTEALQNLIDNKGNKIKNE